VAVWLYWQATSDEGYLLAEGAEILFELARFWASRAERSADGRWHVRVVIGPDEYHEGVDDNAYTNQLAGWLLTRAGGAGRLAGRASPRPLAVFGGGARPGRRRAARLGCGGRGAG
jgi:trehalose/maltose hydrolase-like predicted phosphorylase